jgi:L-ascorbate metabolism protein UlaG (beta-lactamase superfamily)
LDHHGVSDYEHVAFMFTLNGIKILHVGDSCKLPVQYENLGLEGENIDILIAPFGQSCSNWTLVFEEENQNPFTIINQYIRPKHIIVSHQNFDTTSPEIQETVDTLATNLPGISFSVFHPTILKQKIYTKAENNIQVTDKPTS